MSFSCTPDLRVGPVDAPRERIGGICHLLCLYEAQELQCPKPVLMTLKRMTLSARASVRAQYKMIIFATTSDQMSSVR